MRRATSSDVSKLVELMAEFYAESNYNLDRVVAAAAFKALIDDDSLGYVWIIDAGGQDVGHLVLTLKYAMEYGGMAACLDDLYVRPSWRNKGLAQQALTEAREFSESLHIHAISVEVAFDNGSAQAAYRKVGFSECSNRQLLALVLRPPTHVV
jgi:GNAT superfamily N-acetyltransferase